MPQGDLRWSGMPNFLESIIALAAAGNVLASQHCYARLNKRGNRLSSEPGGMERRFQDANDMKTSKSFEMVHEGSVAAKVEIDVIESGHPWALYISAAGMQKLDAVRLALRRGDLKAATESADVFTMVPVAAE